MDEEWDRIVEELAEAIRSGLHWIPSRTLALDGTSNPAKTRITNALKQYDIHRIARRIRGDIEGIEAIERSDGKENASPLG